MVFSNVAHHFEKLWATKWEGMGCVFWTIREKLFIREYFLPFGLQRIDCMLLGKDALKRDNVILIELKQWSNQTVHCSTAAGNFRISPDSVSALTGGCWREVEHPSQQVRGYCGHLQNFIDVISKENWVLTCILLRSWRKRLFEKIFIITIMFNRIYGRTTL